MLLSYWKRSEFMLTSYQGSRRLNRRESLPPRGLPHWRANVKSHHLKSIAVIAVYRAHVVCGFDARATSVLPLDLDQITAHAEHIVHVRCTGNDVEPHAAVGVATVTTFVVLDRAKGADRPTFTVRQAGGELDGLAVDFHVPKFSCRRRVRAVHAAGVPTGPGLARWACRRARSPSCTARRARRSATGSDFADIALRRRCAASVPAGIAATAACAAEPALARGPAPTS